MGRTRETRAQVVASIRESLKRANAVFLTNVSGLAGPDAVRLRRSVREAGGGLAVARNTLIKRAAAGTPAEGLLADLAGPSALAFSFGDPSLVAKGLVETGDELGGVPVRGGVVDGARASRASILAMASLPPRAEMLGTALASMMAPLSSFVRLLDAVRRAKEEAGGEGGAGDAADEKKQPDEDATNTTKEPTT